MAPTVKKPRRLIGFPLQQLIVLSPFQGTSIQTPKTTSPAQVRAGVSEFLVMSKESRTTNVRRLEVGNCAGGASETQIVCRRAVGQKVRLTLLRRIVKRFNAAAILKLRAKIGVRKSADQAATYSLGSEDAKRVDIR
jgi:hypothetical protein